MYLPLLSLVAGLPGALAPERTIRAGARLVLGPTYENADALSPRDWYVRAFRLQSLGAVLAGVLGLLLDARRDENGDEGGAGDPN